MINWHRDLVPQIGIARFDPEHLAQVLALCEAEGWATMPSDPNRALRALTSPGVVSAVAVADTSVIGVAQLLSDGAIQSYLALLVVSPPFRGTGVARNLIDHVYERSRTIRVDLLADEGATGFYERHPHQAKPGFRLYPPLTER